MWGASIVGKYILQICNQNGIQITCFCDLRYALKTSFLSTQSYEDIVYGKRVNSIIRKMRQGTKCICNSCSNMVKADDYEEFITFKISEVRLR